MFDKLKILFQKKHLTNKHILMAEDNPIDRKIISKILKKGGYNVTESKDGQEALNLIKLKIPDLVLLDCEMPVMGGVEACRRIKEDEMTKNVPVLFLTGLDTPKNIIDFFDADASNYLSKPVDAGMLLSEIEEILEESTLKFKK